MIRFKLRRSLRLQGSLWNSVGFSRSKTKQLAVSAEPNAEPALKPDPVVVKMDEDPHPISSEDFKMDIDDKLLVNNGCNVEFKEEEEEDIELNSNAMELEDDVVAEYDVYFNPSESDSDPKVIQEI